MRRLCLAVTFRMLLAGIFSSMIGFTWALATSSRDSGATASAVSATGRIVGSGLRFSNPFLLAGQDSQFPSGGDVSTDPDGFDLGDAAIGSQVVRYITALGGVTPYFFSSSNLASGLTLEPTGRLRGAIAAGAASPVKFTAQVTDTAGVSRTGIFRLGLPSSTVFRFAHDRLSTGQVGQDYITNLEVLGGDSTNTTFSEVAGATRLNGVSVGDLKVAGLQLFADGTLAGRPLVSGTINFTASAVRGASRALDRTGTVPDQMYTITINAASSIQSVFAITSAQIRAGRPLKDTLNFSALINTDGLRSRDFANQPFVLRVAGRTFSATLNSRGQTGLGDFRVTLNALKGTLKVQLKNQDFSKQFGIGPFGAFDADVVYQLQIGDNYLGTEIVQMKARARRGQVQLQYRLGKNIQLGGLFQITNLKAGDFIEGTAFRARFLVSHVRGNTFTQFGTPTNATVHIGQGFNQTVALSRGKGKFPPAGVRRVNINTKTKIGDIETYPLTQSQTGIPPATSSGGNPQTFLLGLEMDTTTPLRFFGEGSRRIFPFVTR